MSNRLAGEQSPYLLQHKDNPVDWYPWSDEAFDKARREDRPVFLSIGYSTCHWCHVMERESFEDEEVAALMNETFVSIKVDREERPDIDGVYMTACQMMSVQGGWPLTVIMTPDKKPFHVATYISKTSRFGRLGMLELIPRIHDVWQNRREDVERTAGQIAAALQQVGAGTPAGPTPDPSAFHEAFRSLQDRFDPEYGGFGDAPKFPSPHQLWFLLRYSNRFGDESAREMVVKTLEYMRLGGIYDHVGYGFHRYSTDRRWLVPHFEKMLYDQALLILAYTEAYTATGKPDLRQTALEIVHYLRRDMQAPEGAFYSAEDADSEGREGKFYLWTTEEIAEVLPAGLAEWVVETFHVEREGNFAEEATRRRTGENILHLRPGERPDPARWEEARALLIQRRDQRVRPGRDDKILTDWNGLTVAALARAAAAFDDPDCLRDARRAADFLLEKVRSGGRLLHRYRRGEASIDGMLDDYAYLIWGLIELYEAGFETRDLEIALELQDAQIESFWDTNSGGFFFTASDAEELIMRQKEYYDGALPSGNAVSASNLLRLARMTGNTEYEERAAQVIRAAAAGLDQMPSAFTALLSALDFAFGPTVEIVISGRKGAPDAEALVRRIRDGFRPNKVVLFKAEDEADLPRLAPYVAELGPIDGRAAAYICRDFTCDLPVSEPAELTALLDRDEPRERPAEAR